MAIGPKTARCRRRSSSFRKSNSEDRNIRSIPLASLLRLAPAQFVLWPADPGAFVLEATSMSMLSEFFFFFYIFSSWSAIMHNYANYVWLEGPVEQYLAGLEAHVRLSLREILEQATCVRDTEDAEEDVPEKCSKCRRIWGCRCFEMCQKISLARKTSRTISTIFNHIQEYTHWDMRQTC